jgi:hypothetical protein
MLSAGCNEVIDVVTLEEVRQTVAYTIEKLPFASEAERAQALEVFLKTSKYDVVVSKVCGRCADYVEQMNASAPQGDWIDYCGPDIYGHSSTHSSLVMHPLDPQTGAPLNGQRSALFSYKGNSGFDLEFAFTTGFFANVTARLQEDSGASGFPDVLLLGASSGLIGVGPDYMGTGESVDLDRSYLTAIPIKQITAVAWYAARAYTSSVTKGCTQMKESVMTQGHSLGGAAVVWATLTLRDLGISIEKCLSHAGVYSNVLIVQGVIGKY